MSDKTHGTLYIITVRPLPSPIPAILRVRRLLKLLLRSFDLKCVDIREHREAS